MSLANKPNPEQMTPGQLLAVKLAEQIEPHLQGVNPYLHKTCILVSSHKIPLFEALYIPLECGAAYVAYVAVDKILEYLEPYDQEASAVILQNYNQNTKSLVCSTETSTLVASLL